MSIGSRGRGVMVQEVVERRGREGGRRRGELRLSSVLAPRPSTLTVPFPSLASRPPRKKPSWSYEQISPPNLSNPPSRQRGKAWTESEDEVSVDLVRSVSTPSFLTVSSSLYPVQDYARYIASKPRPNINGSIWPAYQRSVSRVPPSDSVHTPDHFFLCISSSNPRSILIELWTPTPLDIDTTRSTSTRSSEESNDERKVNPSSTTILRLPDPPPPLVETSSPLRADSSPPATTTISILEQKNKTKTTRTSILRRDPRTENRPP